MLFSTSISGRSVHSPPVEPKGNPGQFPRNWLSLVPRGGLNGVNLLPGDDIRKILIEGGDGGGGGGELKPDERAILERAHGVIVPVKSA